MPSERRLGNVDQSHLRNMAFVMDCLVHGMSLEAIIEKMKADKILVLACVLSIIYYRWIDCYVDFNKSGATATTKWVVTKAGKQWLEKLGY